MFLASLNTEVFKYALIACSAPLWIPFLKAVYAELNDALAAEGGLLGRPPSQKELASIERDPNRSRSPLVSHDFDPGNPPHAGRGQAARRDVANVGRAGTSAHKPRGAPAAPQSVGFSKPRSVRGFARKDPDKR